MITTLGKILVNEQLPEPLRDYDRVLDKKSLRALMENVARTTPDNYSHVNDVLHGLGAEAATSRGNEASLTLDSLRTPDVVKAMHSEIRSGVEQIMKSKEPQEDKNQKIVGLINSYTDKVTKANFDEAVASNNPLGIQAASGSRGNANQLRSLRGGDLLVSDHRDEPIPIPILSSFSEGLDPVEYWAGSYGARKGTLSTKMSTPKSGYIGKQMALAAHQMVVTEKNCGTKNGIVVPASDPDNEGAVLAKEVGGVPAGTVLSARHLKQLGDKNIVVRSALSCQAHQGVCQHCAGVREQGKFPAVGSNLGIAAAQAASEPLSQGALSVKHTGGQANAGKTTSKGGLDLINQLIQVPTQFPGGASIARAEGEVSAIDPAPQGGHYVRIGELEHWIPPEEKAVVTKGQRVEAGDMLSTGLPNPALIAEHKGIGEGRRQFVDTLRTAMAGSGVNVHRRNLELVARGLMNHVRITDADGPANTIPDDLTEYDSIARDYEPRHGFKMVHPKQAVGMYLEEPSLHYSIGTPVTHRVAQNLSDNGVDSIKAHADKPSFTPDMSRAMETLSHSNDWMVRMGGLYGVKRSVIKAVHRNMGSEEHGSSYIPALAKGIDFGKKINTEGLY